MIALGLSMLVNGALLAVLGFAIIQSAVLRKKITPPPAPVESVAMIFPETVQALAAAPPEAAPKPRFARTSEDQAAPRSRENAPFLGERDTRATSDRTPDRNAARMPSQAGIEPRDESEIETTESQYQDGSLDSSAIATPPSEPTPTPPVNDPIKAPDPSPPMQAAAVKNPDAPGSDPERSTPPPPDELLQGPNPVDVQVPKPAEEPREIKPVPEQRIAEESPPAPKPADDPKTVEAPKPKPSAEPAFKGYQRKTAVVGSISRTGRSSLEVADTPLGRYQAAISRAVEQEWQRNCVRHRDFITPGFLTVRFFVETSGKIRSVQFVGDMETGEIQKGFTLNSIRDAEIPSMPKSLRKEYDAEPLELIFRFYF